MSQVYLKACGRQARRGQRLGVVDAPSWGDPIEGTSVTRSERSPVAALVTEMLEGLEP